MIQRNRHIPCVLGLEELILLKCSYCPSESTNLMHSLSKHLCQFSHFHRTNNPKIYREPQKTSNYHSNLGKEQNWRNHTSWFTTTLQSYSNQNSMLLKQKQTLRSVEVNRETKKKKKKKKPTHLWSINMQQTRPQYTMEKRQSLQ